VKISIIGSYTLYSIFVTSDRELPIIGVDAL